MNKKLLAVAIGAALSAPMLAQADVKVSGQANMSLDYIDTVVGNATYSGTSGNITSGDVKKLWNVSSNSSFIKFEANEDLGGGVKAIASVLEYVRMDNLAGANTGSGTTSNNNNTSANVWTNNYYYYTNTRNSNRLTDGNAFAGLSTGFGTVILGSNDTPAKVNGRSADLFNNQIGDSRNADAANNRWQNMVSYISPTMGGVTVTAMHATNLDNSTYGNNPGWVGGSCGTSSGYTTCNWNPIPSLAKGNSLGVVYKGGPVMVGAAIDILTPNGTYTTGRDDEKWTNLAASFDVGMASIKAMYQQHENVGSKGPQTVPTDKTTYGIGASFTFGNEKVKVQYYNVTDSKAGSADAGASIIAVGYDHAFSKSTTAYIAYAQAASDVGKAYSMAGGGHGDQVFPVQGDTMSGLSMGAIINF